MPADIKSEQWPGSNRISHGDKGAKEAIASRTFDADAPRLVQISDSEVVRALNKLESLSSQTSASEKAHTLVSPEASQAVGL
jgi:hypothetical protein